MKFVLILIPRGVRRGVPIKNSPQVVSVKPDFGALAFSRTVTDWTRVDLFSVGAGLETEAFTGRAYHQRHPCTTCVWKSVDDENDREHLEHWTFHAVRVGG